MECGDRVVVRIDIIGTDNETVRAGEVGMVVGHRGMIPVVSLDRPADGGRRRYVMWPVQAFQTARSNRGSK